MRGPVTGIHHRRVTRCDFARLRLRPPFSRPLCPSRWPGWQAQDLDCSDFQTQADAQAVYNQDSRDPNDLDLDHDGTACEALFGGPPGSGEGPSPTSSAPSGGVETGAGGTAGGSPEDSPELLVLGVAGGAVLAAGGVVLARRRSVRRSD